MKTTIELAKEAGFSTQTDDFSKSIIFGTEKEIEAFRALVEAEQAEQHKYAMSGCYARAREAEEKVAELQQKILGLEAMQDKMFDALENIKFMGMDCPMQADRESFYSTQLRKCISIAANLEDKQ